jgi:orotate phosphoribosyltransferase
MRASGRFASVWNPTAVRETRAPAKKDDDVNTEDVLNEFREAGALREGHFVLSSGLHSPVFLQKNLVFMHPDRCERLCAALADRIRGQAGDDLDVVISPAVGGIIPGYETARQLGLPSLYVEREGGRFKLRRGFAIRPGARVVMVEDIVTTGLSSRECIEAIQAAGGEVVCAACIVDRSGGRADVGVPLVALATLDVPAYPADQLPPELAAVPIEDPGSRRLGA